MSSLDPRVNREGQILPKTYLIVALDLKSDTYLYRGEIADWILDRTGTLDRFVLTDVDRRAVTGDATAESPSTWYKVRSSSVILKYADCRSIPIDHTYRIKATDVEVHDTPNVSEIQEIKLQPSPDSIPATAEEPGSAQSLGPQVDVPESTAVEPRTD